MKKILTLTFVLLTQLSIAQFWQSTSYRGAFPQTDGTPLTDWTYGWSNFNPQETFYPQTTTILSSDIQSNTTISGVVLLKNKVYVKNNSTLTILPGTIIRGDNPTQGTLIITKGSKILAEGNELNPIVFTSNQSEGNRSEGDWGGLVILGKAINNQPGGVANIEGIVPTLNTEHGGNDDYDNSGTLKYIRIEFAGIPLEPNKEINGITFGSVGNQTIVDFIQVSHSGDDSFEWFGGSVDCKHLISYKGIDDDFDTDFGYHGKVQFGLSIRDKSMSDAAGDSNCFESDNDAQGSSATPQTTAIFSNITILGPLMDGVLPVGEKFEKALRLRRNTSISIFNSIVVGWEKGLSLEGQSVETNVINEGLVFSNNTLSEFTDGMNCITAPQSVYNSFFTQLNNDTTNTISSINWVNLISPNYDLRLNSNSVCLNNSDFTNSKFEGGFLENIQIETNKIEIFPNPTSNVVNIKNYDNSDIFLLNADGRVLLKTNQSHINLNQFNDGIFYLKIKNLVKPIILNK